MCKGSHLVLIVQISGAVSSFGHARTCVRARCMSVFDCNVLKFIRLGRSNYEIRRQFY